MTLNVSFGYLFWTREKWTTNVTGLHVTDSQDHLTLRPECLITKHKSCLCALELVDIKNSCVKLAKAVSVNMLANGK